MKKPLSILSRPTTEDVELFPNDCFEYKAFAEKLVGYIDRLHNGATIAIDAPWGEGKTYFCKNLKMMIESNRKVVLIDAFERDFIEDPFLLITAELSSLLKSNDPKGMLSAGAANAIKAMAPIGGKILLGALSKFTTGSIDGLEEIGEAVKNAAEGGLDEVFNAIKKKIDDYESESKSIDKFREYIAEIIKDEPKPVVVIIDELDRCRPDFAVLLLERIKHFFDVPNLVFILAINRDQIEASIKGLYGESTNAGDYLGKFIHLNFRLPKPSIAGSRLESIVYRSFIADTFGRYRFSDSETNQQDWVIEHMVFISVIFSLTLRNIEKLIATYIISGMNSSLTVIYMAAIKIKKYPVYVGLMNGDMKAHSECEEMLLYRQNLLQEGSDRHTWLNAYLEAHQVILAKRNLADCSYLLGRSDIFDRHRANSPNQMFSQAIACIDPIINS